MHSSFASKKSEESIHAAIRDPELQALIRNSIQVSKLICSVNFIKVCKMSHCYCLFMIQQVLADHDGSPQVGRRE